jgi:hypothetical protein
MDKNIRIGSIRFIVKNEESIIRIKQIKKRNKKMMRMIEGKFE